MIAVLTKCLIFKKCNIWSQSSQNDRSAISKDCDHDHSLHTIHYLWGLLLKILYFYVFI